MAMQRSSISDPTHDPPPPSPIINENSSKHSNSSIHDDDKSSHVDPTYRCPSSRSPQNKQDVFTKKIPDRGSKRATKCSVPQSSVSSRKNNVLTPKMKKFKDPISYVSSNLSQIPLLQGLSGYLNSQVSDVTSTNASTSLEKLTNLVRLSEHQGRERIYLRKRLQRFLISNALSARFLRCGELAYQSLVDDFKAGEKKHFASIYDAIHDVRDSCNRTRQYIVSESDYDIEPVSPEGDDSLNTFFNEIPSRYQEVLLRFISRIRTDPDFLASRFSSLSSSNLSELVVFSQSLEVFNNPMASSSNNNSKSTSSTTSRYSSNRLSAVEYLLSFQRHDPLSALIHTCFASSTNPDSPEDTRRLNVWATACARLIMEQKPGADKFISTVLNIWTNMRDWAGRNHMKLYLMKILQDGEFLLDKSENQVTGRAGNNSTNIDDIILASEDYYKSAVQGIFEIIGDPSTGGIPEGLLELGNAILRKLDIRWHQSTRRFLVSKWLFSVFLLKVIVHPESCGIMIEFHITEYGRQKILKEVFARAQKLIIDVLWKSKVNTPQLIKSHIDNILLQFSSNRLARPNVKLIETNSLKSLRSSAESHPYIVIGPADLITLVNALFPGKGFASSTLPRASKPCNLRSFDTSRSEAVNTISITPSSTPQKAFDNSSVFSISSSSVTSEFSTSREPLLNSCSKIDLDSCEDDGYELHVAIYEMQQVLGLERVSGACHPYAEKWAVIFISSDGDNISTKLPNDPADDIDDEDEFTTTSSDCENDGPSSPTDLDKDYHQIRDTILKLVHDYEIPKSLNSEKELKNPNKNFTHTSQKKNQNFSGPSNLQLSKNPYRASTDFIYDSDFSQVKERRNLDCDSNRPLEKEPPCILLSMLKAAKIQCQAQEEFVNAHRYCTTLRQLNQISSHSLKSNGFSSLLNIFSRGPRDSIRRSTSAIEEYETWLTWLKQSQECYDTINQSLMTRIKALRDKMWYVTDVKNSAAYEGTRNVAIALKCMMSLKKTTTNRPQAYSNLPPTKDFLLKTEAQIIDVMAAIEEQGGPNKLSDEQSDKTLRWLSHHGIENFCKGEERIHRFCLEIESCINKLVGENLTDGPVLWSSELFSRDKKLFDKERLKNDLLINGLGTLSCTEESRNESEPRRGLGNIDTSRPGFRDFRAISSKNLPQKGIDSGNILNRLRINAHTSNDLIDSQDSPGTASHMLTTHSPTTFWSPSQSIARSKAVNSHDNRMKTSSSFNEMISKEGQVNQKKKRFLLNLKQTLTSLLLSDLGNLIFSRGSETDNWFSGDMGQNFLNRKQHEERKVRRKSTKQRLLKNKSFKEQVVTQKIDPKSESAHTRGRRTDSETLFQSACSVSGDVNISDDKPIIENPVFYNTTLTNRQRFINKEIDSSDFSYKKAFQKMFKYFSVTPSPYDKLNILLEVEQLIVGLLTPSANRRHRIRKGTLSTTPSSPDLQYIDAFAHDCTSSISLAKNLEQTIDKCRERRSQKISQNDIMSSTHKTAELSLSTSNLASTDMIVEVLQDIFRDPEICPKTLFRDLQFIASLVPSQILDNTQRGKAFWNAGLAALGLKQDVCRILIETADEIVVNHTQTRTTITPSVNVDQTISRTNFSMRDALKMWTIAAKEGDPVAERELAIFYLTHPEIEEKITAPLSKPCDTFKAQAAKTWDDEDSKINNVATMYVAYHWMELSALGGDKLAKNYLKQREDSSDSTQ